MAESKDIGNNQRDRDPSFCWASIRISAYFHLSQCSIPKP